MDNRFSYIEEKVLCAKIGIKSSFKELWEMYLPLIHDIIKSLIEENKILIPYRSEIFHDCYVFVWDIIKEYKTEDKFIFSFFLKKRLIEKLIKSLEENYKFKNIKFNEIYLSSFYCPNKNQKIKNEIFEIRKIYKFLTVKQMKIMHHLFYLDLGFEEAMKTAGFEYIELVFIFNKFLKNRYKLRKNGILEEKVGLNFEPKEEKKRAVGRPWEGSKYKNTYWKLRAKEKYLEKLKKREMGKENDS